MKVPDSPENTTPLRAAKIRSLFLGGLAASLLWGIVNLPAPRPAGALLRALSLERMALKSRLIVTGEVVDLVSYRAPLGRIGTVIFTDVTVRIQGVLKGDPDNDTVTVQVLGGTIGEVNQFCPDSARYRKGEKVLLFLREYQGRMWNCGWIQGKYRLSDDGETIRGQRKLPIATDMKLTELESRLRAISRDPSFSTRETTSESSSQEDGRTLERTGTVGGGAR